MESERRSVECSNDSVINKTTAPSNAYLSTPCRRPRDVLKPSMSGQGNNRSEGRHWRGEGERKIVSSVLKRSVIKVNNCTVEHLPLYAMSKAGAMSSRRPSRAIGPQANIRSEGKH